MQEQCKSNASTRGTWRQTYAGSDLDLLLLAAGHGELVHGAVELDVDVGHALYLGLQGLGEGLQAILEGEDAGVLERLEELRAEVELAVQGAGGVDVVRVGENALGRAVALRLHAEVAAQDGAVAALELPGLGEQRLGAQLPDVAGVDAVVDGRDDVVGNALVDAAGEEGADGLVGERHGALGLPRLLGEAQDAGEDAAAPKGEEVARARQLRGQAVEAVGVVDEAVLRAGFGALGDDQVVDKVQLFNLRPSAGGPVCCAWLCGALHRPASPFALPSAHSPDAP